MKISFQVLLYQSLYFEKWHFLLPPIWNGPNHFKTIKAKRMENLDYRHQPAMVRGILRNLFQYFNIFNNLPFYAKVFLWIKTMSPFLLSERRDARRHLENGVTSILDMEEPLSLDMAVPVFLCAEVGESMGCQYCEFYREMAMIATIICHNL